MDRRQGEEIADTQAIVDNVADEISSMHLPELERAQGLRPFVLQITNDPDPHRCAQTGFVPDAVASLPGSGGMSDIVSAIIKAVVYSRDARGSQASELLSYHLDDDTSGYEAEADKKSPSFGHIRVCPRLNEEKKYQDLSMSWWLSHPVQRYLDHQVCEPENLRQIAKVLMALLINANNAEAIKAALQKICPITDYPNFVALTK